ncbi:MAG: hypothetical protein K1X67_09570 [Fimbriimonadaceae bacterium]|nr:hypothetical protein [Fimbriimonadaceae bacterium]
MARRRAEQSAQPFPIVEAFGYSASATTPEAKEHRERHHCPFAGNSCEKFRQYRFGYCSVTYAAADDEGRRYTYAVCDHRVDGAPLAQAISDHYGTQQVELVPEVVLTDPRTSFDYVAVRREGGRIVDAIAIETQAIDIRGGGVGPAWAAWYSGDSVNWRAYFSKEAETKGRRDTVAYGVNMANIYKRLGLQVATKGTFLKAIGVPFYVVMQDRPFRYLKRRVNFKQSGNEEPWDITFVTFDYTGNTLTNGQLEFVQMDIVRTTVEEYTKALSADHRASADQRESFLQRVDIKSKGAATSADAGPSDERTGLLI